MDDPRRLGAHVRGSSGDRATAVGRARSRVTLADVAERAGVHVSTASRALDPGRTDLVSPHTRRRVAEAAAALAYEPPAGAGRVRRASFGTVGVIVPDISNPVYAPIIRGIENTLEGRQMMALVAETQHRTDRLRRVLDHLRRRQADAIITTAARSSQAEMLRGLDPRIPVVLAACHMPETGLPHVTYDDERGGLLVAEHLLELGHRRVAMIRGPADITTFAARGRAFVRRLRGADVVVVESREEAELPTIAEGMRLAVDLLDTHREPPTAVFAQNDELAIGTLEVLRSRGVRCPADVALVGYNDVPVARLMTPPLTTVRLPAYELGRMAADIAVGVLAGDAVDTAHICLPLTLQARASTLGERAVAWPHTGDDA